MCPLGDSLKFYRKMSVSYSNYFCYFFQISLKQTLDSLHDKYPDLLPQQGNLFIYSQFSDIIYEYMHVSMDWTIHWHMNVSIYVYIHICHRDVFSRLYHLIRESFQIKEWRLFTRFGYFAETFPKTNAKVSQISDSFPKSSIKSLLS